TRIRSARSRSARSPRRAGARPPASVLLDVPARSPPHTVGDLTGRRLLVSGQPRNVLASPGRRSGRSPGRRSGRTPERRSVGTPGRRRGGAAGRRGGSCGSVGSVGAAG